MGNVNQAFTYLNIKDAFGHPLAEPQQKVNDFAVYFHGVSSDSNYSANIFRYMTEIESTHGHNVYSSSDSWGS